MGGAGNGDRSRTCQVHLRGRELENNMSAMVRYVDGLTESATTSTEQAQSNLKAMRTLYPGNPQHADHPTTEQISRCRRPWASPASVRTGK